MQFQNQQITGKTRLVAIIGNPVSHSISPIIHNHALRLLNIPLVYVPLAVHQSSLHDIIHALRACEFAGANVTIPYKNSILSFCDVLSPLSELTQTVNTLYYRNGLLYGTTTDAQGFFSALDDIPYSRIDADIVILGNGGTAQTIGFALAQERRCNSLCFVGRNLQSVQSLAARITQKTNFPCGTSTFGSAESTKLFKRCTLVVNATSVGMSPAITETPLDKSFFHSRMTVFDAIYNPAKTLFLHEAAQAGCVVENGLRMLLHQACASFTYWTGITISPTQFDVSALQALITDTATNTMSFV